MPCRKDTWEAHSSASNFLRFPLQTARKRAETHQDGAEIPLQKPSGPPVFAKNPHSCTGFSKRRKIYLADSQRKAENFKKKTK